MNDYGTTTVLVLTVVGTVVILGIVVFLRSRQDKTGDKK